MTQSNEPDSPPVVEAGHPHVIDTTTGQAHGHDSCPQCGSTEVARKGVTLSLMCQFCRYEWVGTRLEDAHGLGEGIGELEGRQFMSGAADITSHDDLVTLKCQGCGSEVVVDTAHSLESRCHWCRSVLSINDKIPNGAVPDGVLPFSVAKEAAVEHIAKFVNKRQFFANKKFKEEFKADNVMGVYLPYMTVDGNVGAVFHGEGEVETRRYTVKTGKTSTTYYDANVFDVVRDFDLHIDDLIVESSSTRSFIDNKANTNNIINSLLPYDVKEMVAFDSNYLGDFSAEKRDLNIDDVAARAHIQFLTMSRESVRDDITGYDRGVRWHSEQLTVHGSRWASVFLPVWLYSYAQKMDNGHVMVHYIAVNGRNGACMGSVPVNKGRLWAVTIAASVATAAVAWPLGFMAMAAGA